MNRLDLPDYCSLIQVNAAINKKWDGCLHDDDYDGNISNKNNSYCELTALHHMWKTCEADIVGLFHYRRYFSGETNVCLKNEVDRFCTLNNLKRKIISPSRITELLENNDIILALPNCPYPVTVYEDLQRFVSVDDIYKMIEVVESYYPEYRKTLIDILYGTNLSYCNMFIARKTDIDKYCEWLFDVLSKIEPLISIEEYDVQHQRIFGYYAEVLLNVYIAHNKMRKKYVYKLDLVEDKGKKLRNFYVNQTLNYIKGVLGVYPRYKWKLLLKARYNEMKSHSMSSIHALKDVNYSAVTYMNYISKEGAREISHIDKEKYSIITALFMEIEVVSYFLRDEQDVSEIIEEIEKTRTIMPFGYAKVYRLWIENSDKKFEENLLRRGIITNVHYC